MDTILFSSLLRNLLQTNVLCSDACGENLNAFEEKYCYSRNLQPFFTAQNLLPLLEAMQDHVLYGLRDDLGIGIIFFRFDNQSFIVGPYVNAEFDAVRIQRVLINARMPAFSETLDYSTLYQRYDMENRFLRMVEMGDTENVLAAYHDMNIYGRDKNRYINAVYQDPTIGLSMARALVRKAAERGGASIVEINEITQRAAQRMAATQHQNEQIRYTLTMIYELTDAVRRHRHQIGNYSEHIKRTVEFLSLNFSQKITLPQLAGRIGLSEVYLSKIFKNEVGMTIFQYIAHLRCTQAAEMLRGSDISIQEISNYVGYPDNNYFVKVFKSYYGMTPSEYRTEKL